MTRLLVLVPLMMLSACMSGLPSLPRAASEPSAQDRIVAECALLSLAEGQMSAPHAGLREGCPGVAARDTRALRAQTAALRRATSADLPDGVAPNSRAELIFRRMITRGVPVALARQLSATAEFQAAAR